MAVRIQTYIDLLNQDLIRAEQLSLAGRLPPVLPVVLYNGASAWIAADTLEPLIEPAPPALAAYRPRQGLSPARRATPRQGRKPADTQSERRAVSAGGQSRLGRDDGHRARPDRLAGRSRATRPAPRLCRLGKSLAIGCSSASMATPGCARCAKPVRIQPRARTRPEAGPMEQADKGQAERDLIGSAMGDLTLDLSIFSEDTQPR